MNEGHDGIQELLALAAAGALATEEHCRVERHVAECPACAAELRILADLARGLRTLPAPKIPPALAARTRASVLDSMARRASKRWDDAVLAVLGLYGWTIGLTGWAILQVLRGGLPALLDVSFVRAVGWLSLSTVVAWLTAGFAAALLARHKRLTGRRVWVA